MAAKAAIAANLILFFMFSLSKKVPALFGRDFYCFDHWIII